MAKKKNQNETTDEQAEIRPLTPEEAKEAAEMADAPDLTGIAISEEAQTSRYVYRLDLRARPAPSRL